MIDLDYLDMYIRVTPFLNFCFEVLLPAFFWCSLMCLFQISDRFFEIREKIDVASRLKVNFGKVGSFRHTVWSSVPLMI